MLEIVGDTLEAGAVVAGAYRLERIVGEGGMGVVWAARELRAGRAVALKFLRDGERDATGRTRFLREARAAMAIAHPHVARVEAVLETDVGTPFLVMELLEGESMRAMLRRKRVLTAQECARILGPVVDAVSSAHARGIVHRDLKPENVFLVGGTDVRVLDFGIAKQLPHEDATKQTSLTSTGALIGTPVYMAPEQIFGDDVDVRADVWALGIILYECLAGQRPTEGSGIGPIIKRITTEPLAPLEQARSGLPKSLTRIVGRMLLRHRDDRPSLDEVRAVLANLPRDGEAEIEAAPTQRMPATGAATAVVDVTGPPAPPMMMPTPPPPAAFSSPIDQVRLRSQMDLASSLSLVAAAVGIVLFFTPVAIAGVVLGLRGRSLAKRAGVSPPVTSTLGLVGGLLGTVGFMVFLPWAVLGIRDDRERAEARIATIERELGDRASAPVLEQGTACALAELYARKNGWEHNTGISLTDFECAGRVTTGPETARLEDLRFVSGPTKLVTNVCFKRGAKWYVTELRKDTCGP